MTRQVHRLEQGSDLWRAHRATPNQINGSEIAAIRGIDKNTSRSELLRMKALGEEKVFSDYVQRRVIDKGHESEELARPIATEIIGDDLSVMVMTDTIDGVLFSVSLDGITQCYETTFEHKSLNMMLADALDAGFLPEQYHDQCEAGLMVSGAARCLFMASKDGDRTTARHIWYYPNPELRKTIIASCKQFDIDLDAYMPEAKTVAPVAAPIKDLPAIIITVTGSLSVETNFKRWGVELREFIARIPEEPSTDQDFADCKAAMVAFKKAEKALDDEEARVLGQVPSVDDMRREKKLLRDLASTTRLALEKLVVRRDMEVKRDITAAGATKYGEHIKALNTRLGGQYMPYSLADPRWGAAIKGLSSFDSMRDKVSAALANAKIEASAIADGIEANIKALALLAPGLDFLFSDKSALIRMDNEPFSAIVVSRVRAHKDTQAEIAETKKVADDKLIADAVAEGIRVAESARELKAAEVMPAAATDHIENILEMVVSEPVTVPEHIATVGVMIDHSVIDRYISLKDLTHAGKKALRLELVAFVKYQSAYKFSQPEKDAA